MHRRHFLASLLALPFVRVKPRDAFAEAVAKLPEEAQAASDYIARLDCTSAELWALHDDLKAIRPLHLSPEEAAYIDAYREHFLTHRSARPGTPRTPQAARSRSGGRRDG